MRRETMEWLKLVKRDDMDKRDHPVDDILAELKRLRRIERVARKVLCMNTAEGLDVALGELADALKRGRR